MPYSPINYGATIGQAENILASQYARDPNSPRNQLLQAQIDAARGGGGNQLSMAPVSFKDATAKSIAAAMQANDPGLLERVPYKPYQLDTETERIFYDINPVTREPTIIAREPINNYDAARDTELGKFNAQLGGAPSSSQGVSGAAPPASALGGGNVARPAQQTPSAAKLAGDKEAEVQAAKLAAEAQSPAEQKKQQMREADAANAKTLIDDMLAPRKDGKGIYATYAYGRENEFIGDKYKPQKWIDAEAKRNQLVSMMQLENVAKLKGTGPITEPEQQVLRQAMTVLENPLISPELVERELKRVRVMFARWEREAKNMQGKESLEKPDFVSDQEWDSLTPTQKKQLVE